MGLTVLIVALVAGLGPLAVVRLMAVGRINSVADVAPHDVAIVFGAGLAGNGPSPYLAARLQVARDLFNAGKVRVILVSGDNLSVSHDEPTVMMNWLTAQGIPADKIVRDFAGQDTYSTCVRARRIFGLASAVLVSQTYHLPRAIATCRLTGLDAVGVGDETVKANDPSRWRRYEFREWLADINMAYEVLSRRVPVLGEPETGVADALGR